MALLASCGRGPSRLLTDAVDVLTLSASAWKGAFAALDAFLARHRDRVCAGWLGYDLGLDVEAWPTALADDFGAPVLHIAAYRTVREFAATPVPPAPKVAAAKSFVAHTTRADYQQRVLDKLRQAIQIIEPAVHASNTNLGFWIGLTKAFDIVKGVKP